MRLLAAGLAGFSVMATVGALRSRTLGERLTAHLEASPEEPGSDQDHRDRTPPGVVATPAVVGILIGAATPGVDSLTLGLLGAGAGVIGHKIAGASRRRTRSRAMRQELPVIADAIALRVLSGESVAGALDAVVETTQGVTSEELDDALADHRGGAGLAEALHAAARKASDPEGARLFDLLGHAHRSGGRLAEALGQLAADYRAALSRDLTAEGGKRALATYAPILGLMVPVALVFLMYPTLAGLSALSEGP